MWQFTTAADAARIRAEVQQSLHNLNGSADSGERYQEDTMERNIALEWHSDIGGRLTGYRASYIAWLLLQAGRPQRACPDGMVDAII